MTTHLIERGDEQDLEKTRWVPALENIDGNLMEAHNCWEVHYEGNGTFSLFSYAPINEHYGAYPQIVINRENARDLLVFLQTHLETAD